MGSKYGRVGMPRSASDAMTVLRSSSTSSRTTYTNHDIRVVVGASTGVCRPSCVMRRSVYQLATRARFARSSSIRLSWAIPTAALDYLSLDLYPHLGRLSHD